MTAHRGGRDRFQIVARFCEGSRFLVVVGTEVLIRGGEANPMKKTYEKPVIIHTEEIEARAVTCAKESTAACSSPTGAPITS